MIVDSTNPRIMANNIRELARNGSGGGPDLPDVTAADNGKVLGVVEGSWNKMDAPSVGVNYSTSEQDTGTKWIDGRSIYQKSYTGKTSTSSTTLLDSSFNLDFLIVDVKGSMKSATNIFPISTWQSDNVGMLGAYVDANGLYLYNPKNATQIRDCDYLFTVYYVKPAETRTKKKTTTKGEN